MFSSSTRWTRSRSVARTAGRCACSSPPCTATSPASGCPRSASPRASSPATGSGSATTRTPGWVGPTGGEMPPRADTLPRFSRAETLVHRSTAALVGVLTLTGAILYFEPLSLLVGRRLLVEGVHVVSGLLLPVPTLVGLWASPRLRADVRLLGRMAPVDAQWLRRRDRRRAGLAVGKFNGGQKLAAATMLGAGLVLFGTGLLP